MVNFTVLDKTSTSELNQTDTWPWPIATFALLSALNIFLSVTATVGNVLILVALHKESSIHPPTKLLFRCLAITDLSVGLFSEPVYVVLLQKYIIPEFNPTIVYYGNYLNYSSSFILCTVSVLVSGAISVDRLLALLLGLRYRHVMTSRRVRAILACFWMTGVSLASLYFWNLRVAFSIFVAFALLVLVTSIFSYAKIYFKLRDHRLQLLVPQLRQPNRGVIPLHVTRYKKTVSSILWVQLTLAVSYVPFVIVVMFRMYGGMFVNVNFVAAYQFTITVFYLNSSLNPILYCWRIKSVRQASMETLRQLNCCKSA